MPDLKGVLAGQPLAIDAATWNELLAMLREWRLTRAAAGSTRPVSIPLTPNLTCLVKYDESSSSTLPVHSVVTLASLIPDLSGDDGDPHGVNRRPAYVAGTPTGPGGQVAVTLEPIQGQSLGRAVVTGQVVALVDVLDADHTTAVPIAGDTDKFESAEEGGYPIVARESGTGEVMAVLLLGASGATGAPGRGAQPLVIQLSDVTGAYGGTGKTTNSGGSWVNSGVSHTNSVYPVLVGGAAFAAASGSQALAWEEPPGSGRFACLPIQYATDTVPGFVSTAAQDFGGDKVFADAVDVYGVTTLHNSLNVIGGVDITGGLAVSGSGTFGGDVTVADDLTAHDVFATTDMSAANVLAFNFMRSPVYQRDGDNVPAVFRVAAPAASGAAGTAGDIAYDSGFLYVCTAANTWKRVAIAGAF